MDVERMRQGATMDQAVAGVADVARVVAAYRKALLAAGVPRGEALALVLDWHGIHWESIYDQAAANKRPGNGSG